MAAILILGQHHAAQIINEKHAIFLFPAAAGNGNYKVEKCIWRCW